MRRLTLVGRRIMWSCHVCGHPVSGLSDVAVQRAMDDHAEHVNRTADRATDPHFEEARIDALLAV